MAIKGDFSFYGKKFSAYFFACFVSGCSGKCEVEHVLLKLNLLENMSKIPSNFDHPSSETKQLKLKV